MFDTVVTGVSELMDHTSEIRPCLYSWVGWWADRAEKWEMGPRKDAAGRDGRWRAALPAAGWKDNKQDADRFSASAKTAKTSTKPGWNSEVPKKWQGCVQYVVTFSAIFKIAILGEKKKKKNKRNPTLATWLKMLLKAMNSFLLLLFVFFFFKVPFRAERAQRTPPLNQREVRYLKRTHLSHSFF